MTDDITDDMTDEMVITRVVDGEPRIVPFATFFDVHEELSGKYRAQGLSGSALDEAIYSEMPQALARALRIRGRDFVRH
jgi:hypothetical protein